VLILFVLLSQVWATTSGKVKTYEEIERVDNFSMDPLTNVKTHSALLLCIITLDNDQVYNVVWQHGPFKTEEQVKKVLKEMRIELQDKIQISDKKVCLCATDYFEGKILHKEEVKEGRILFCGPFGPSYVHQIGQELTLTRKQMVNDGGLMAHDYLKVWFEDFN